MRCDRARAFAISIVFTVTHPETLLARVETHEAAGPPVATPTEQTGDFTIEHVTLPKRVQPGGDEYVAYVRVSGDLPDAAVLESIASWHLTARAQQQEPNAIDLTSAMWDSTTRNVALIFRRPALGDPQSYKWKVLFTGNNLNVIAVPASAGSGTGLESALGKDDADVYVSGTWLAGRGSAPLFALDAKYAWAKEVGMTPWDVGVLAQASVNADAELPAATSAFDLDAISAAFAARYTMARPGLVFDFHPVRGEFTKTLGAGDIVGMARMTKLLKPVGPAAIRPYAGFELGVPVVKPDSLYEQAVDLSGWKSAVRLVAGFNAVFYVFRPDATPDDPYAFSVDLSLAARKPFTDEPYATTETVDGKATTVVRLRQNARPVADAGFTWNINEFFGLEAKYRYGSLPPVFKLVDHQIAVGLTFKAKRTGARPAMF